MSGTGDGDRAGAPVKRRTVLAGLGSSVAAWPLTAAAQLVPHIAYLDGASVPQWFEAFRSGLRDLGYVENQTAVIHRHVIAGRSQDLAQLAQEIVRLRPQVIVVSGSRPSLALKGATTTIPIIVVFATDLVGLGLVDSLARPGGNVTGLSNMGGGLMAKRLQLLLEIIPNATSVGVIWAPVNREVEFDFREMRSAAIALGLQLESFEVTAAEEYDAAFEKAAARVKCVAVLSGPLAFANRATIVAAAVRHKVPAIYYDLEYAVSGGLISYGPSLAGLHRQAAKYVARVLKGEKPAELPVEEPANFELVLNLKSAKALGLTLPPAILARADQVIE